MLTKMCDVLAVWHVLSYSSRALCLAIAGRLAISDMHLCTVLMTLSVQSQKTVTPYLFAT